LSGPYEAKVLFYPPLQLIKNTWPSGQPSPFNIAEHETDLAGVLLHLPACDFQEQPLAQHIQRIDNGQRRFVPLGQQKVILERNTYIFSTLDSLFGWKKFPSAWHNKILTR